MRIIEKKCPNCGASIHIEDDTRNITCEYCHSKFRVTKDPTEQGMELISIIGKGIMISNIMSAILVIGIIVVFGVVFINLSKQSNLDNPTNVSDKSTKPTTQGNSVNKDKEELEDKDSINIDDLYDRYFKDLAIEPNALSQNLPKNSKITDYENVGSYFLLSKLGNDLDVYVIYKRTLNYNKEKKDFYIVQLYTDLDYENINNSFSMELYAPTNIIDNKNLYYVRGYENINELYNEHIKPLSNEYNITIKGNLYNG